MPGRKTKTVRFRERADLLDFLLELATSMAETLDLDRALALVAEYVKRVLPYDLFAILLYSERRAGLRVRYSLGHREEVVNHLVIPLGQGLTGAAAQTRQPVLVGNVQEDPRYMPTVDAVRTELAVPMVSQGKLVGVIDVQSTALNAYGEYESSVLSLIGSRVASVIQNARLHRRVEGQNRMLRILTRLAREFSSILVLDELLDKIASELRELFAMDSFTILLPDFERKVLRPRFSMRYDERAVVEDIPFGEGITGSAFATGKAVRLHNTLLDPRYIPSHPDIRSEVALPLMCCDKVVGVMDLESEQIGYFTDEKVRLLSLLTPQISTAVENARLYQVLADREARIEQDLKHAEELQKLMLPRTAPPVEGLDLAVMLEPALRISGDIYHFFEYADGSVMIAFGDVSGKGVAAALYGGLVSGLLSTLAPRHSNPSLLLGAINRALLERGISNRYVALYLMKWLPGERTFRMANAGALPPYILRRGEAIQLRPEGVPLGLLQGNEYEEIVFQAEPDDLIVLYSDGITDQENPEGEEYGRERLCQLVRQKWRQRPAELIESLVNEIREFAGSDAKFDDQTLLVAKVTGS